MNKKHIRPTADQQLIEGEYDGKIVGAYEKVFKSHYNPNGQQDFLSLRVRVDHQSEIYFLFYNVPWEWMNYRFCKLLEDMDVMPEPGAEFNPESLIGKNITICVENKTSQGRNFANIVNMRLRSAAANDEMDGEQWVSQEQGGGR